MAKAEKPKKQERPKVYEETLKVKGSFLDVIQASVNAANKKNGKKKEGAMKYKIGEEVMTSEEKGLFRIAATKEDHNGHVLGDGMDYLLIHTEKPECAVNVFEEQIYYQ